MGKSKVFQFNPSDYSTDYQTIKKIYHFGFVVDLGKTVAVEYSYDWQLIGLFSLIANPPLLEDPQSMPVIKPNKMDKWIAVILIPLLIWYLVWLFF